MNENMDINDKSEKVSPQRPWDLLEKVSDSGLHFDEELNSAKEPQLSSIKKEVTTKATFLDLFKILQQNQVLMLASFLAFSLVLGFFAFKIPSSYYSTLHLYAPEKTDSIGTRLSLFTQRLEYASFPVDYKTPISLISRRMHEESARSWVIDKFKSDPAYSNLVESSVSVDTNYVPNQEILAIEAYANTPELAVIATNYYWNFLIKDIQDLEQIQNTKIKKWFDLTNRSLNQQISDTMKVLEGTTAKTFQKTGITKLQDSMGDVFSRLEMKKSSLQKQLTELKVLSKRTDFVDFTESLDPETSGLLKIYNQLLLQKDVISPVQIEGSRLAIIDTINKRTRETENQLNSIRFGQDKAQNEMSTINVRDNSIKVAAEQEMDLRSQLVTLRMQKSDLIKFKSQIEMESSIRSAQFKVIRVPAPNPASVKPLPSVKYSVVVLISAILSIAVALAFHLTFRAPRKLS